MTTPSRMQRLRARLVAERDTCDRLSDEAYDRNDWDLGERLGSRSAGLSCAIRHLDVIDAGGESS